MAPILESGHTIEKVVGEEMEKLKNNWNLYDGGAIRLRPHGWWFPAAYEKHANLIYNFPVRPSDIYVMTMPKSGTNWIQEIAWNLVHNPDLNNPDANMSIDYRCPFYESDFVFDSPGCQGVDPDSELMKRFNKLCPGVDPSDGIFRNMAAFVPEPRLIKNHMPCCLLPQEMFKISKVIYLTRDPRDIIVSYYHFSKLHTYLNFRGTFEDFVDDYLNGRVMNGPYWEHVKQAWEKRNDPNFLFLFYEDLKADPKSVIKKVDSFLGTNRTYQQIENIVQYTSFESMKERTKDNPPTSVDNTAFNEEEVKKGGTFFRKGKSGSWKEDFTPEIEEKVHAWMRENQVHFGDDFKYKI